MNIELIEELLNEEESSTLDFKSEQYPFSGASDDEKSEMLKDILAFSNAWRRTDAYILVGIKEVKGERSEVAGITSDLDDASIQQFVNSKTNRNIEFSYKTVSIEGDKIGVFHIPLQERPFYLKKDYGKLKKDTVYIRRSSSTGTADIEEIAKIGAVKFDKYQQSNIPKLELQFFNNEDKMLLGKSLSVNSVNLIYDKNEIVGRKYDYFQRSLALSVDHNFEKKMANYLFKTNLVKPVWFHLNNISSSMADNVRIEFVIVKDEIPVFLTDKNDYPKKPTRDGINIQRNIFANPKVENSTFSWNLSAYIGNIQPKASSHSDVFYVGSSKSCSLKFEAMVFADNLPEPLKFPLLININTKDVPFDVSDLLKIN